MKRTFEIGYKLRYAETEDWGTEYLKAVNKKQALQNFAKRMKIQTNEFKSFEDWHWNDGVWWARFKYIKEVQEKTCPHCEGIGIIHI